MSEELKNFWNDENKIKKVEEYEKERNKRLKINKEIKKNIKESEVKKIIDIDIKEFEEYEKNKENKKRIKNEKINKKAEVKKIIDIDRKEFEEYEKHKENKKTIKNEKVNKTNFPYITIIYLSILLGLIMINEVFLGIGILLYIAIWIYSFFSIISNNFKRTRNKILWLIILFLIPALIIFYPEMKENQVT